MDLNVRIEVNYTLDTFEESTKSVIEYTFHLYDGVNDIFGKLNAVYNVIIPIPMKILEDNIELQHMVLRKALIENGDNVRELIREELSKNDIQIDETEFYNKMS